MRPLTITSAEALGWRRWSRGISLQPVANHVVIELLRPEHAGKRLPHHVAGVLSQIARNYRGVELIGFANAFSKDLFEACAEWLRFGSFASQPQAHGFGLARLKGKRVTRCCFRAASRRFDRANGTIHHVLMDAVLHIWPRGRNPNQALHVRL